MGATSEVTKVIYWRRDLPPLEAEQIGDHVVEADSRHVKEDLSERGTLWDQRHDDVIGASRSGCGRK